MTFLPLLCNIKLVTGSIILVDIFAILIFIESLDEEQAAKYQHLGQGFDRGDRYIFSFSFNSPGPLYHISQYCPYHLFRWGFTSSGCLAVECSEYHKYIIPSQILRECSDTQLSFFKDSLQPIIFNIKLLLRSTAKHPGLVKYPIISKLFSYYQVV
ncbi:hypothetical protein PHYBLDRAFT_58261 [Phycomyces blakesleeanus NRRL 1555(-)]|uniref:Uncharacterized protein n=1 Tax=Phycomyces blakesleeanus (strain ATCC 8743b / DSM 1359 / FGSC 10004 / NBRC 33097 / NRRL 1555) TaxID=763407 RepID=A0A162V0P3_PHYB8|nr:hypothetical protein PHYBLDRAFT_58261 [Phycomyces blakesleeanus NRRL 1555(-)]OAD79213.1 hypothetical protein PHYBLDRAFT_58261 [Phycomyces blakesleeanus NRRL 1555(-)]|eukprot:XP_018297253.1 hypothetical protein PHYBLDRAFT_58261 [Phycomyces blakesleeanus NRRL 1555(-)]